MTRGIVAEWRVRSVVRTRPDVERPVARPVTDVCLGLVNDNVDVSISRDKFSVKPESLILAQNERWRQA